MATALVADGVLKQAISIIPDEQEAIDAALHMGQPGDLLLIFADALVRSWKQITKFRPAGAPEPQARAPAPPPTPTMLRDERRAAAVRRASKVCCATNAAFASRRRSTTERPGRTAVRQLAAPHGQQPVLRSRPAQSSKRSASKSTRHCSDGWRSRVARARAALRLARTLPSARSSPGEHAKAASLAVAAPLRSAVHRDRDQRVGLLRGAVRRASRGLGPSRARARRSRPRGRASTRRCPMAFAAAPPGHR